ncbi:CDP-alcohol phosphatidyltransferase family protein [Solirhodobacter olei]|uniref:CDP-alcohol phosphatidyltransferase family protein n=1 Tax=Solirhodobacter olei TaxID=2493082 RepID=UPI000FDA0AF2|nr:CDP-alcohol phosphatidyltransferase family protein [Solirhodobacter olei]
MLDATVRRLIDPPLNRAGRWLAARGAQADVVTLAGLALGLLAAGLIREGHADLALLPLLLSRLADGLDGAVARAGRKSDFGGYLDIVADFLVYGAVPLAFIAAAPAANGAAGGYLLLSFYVNGASFLGFAILAERHGLTTEKQGKKSLYFSDGLLEGTETILFLCALCLWPAVFAPMCWAFGTLCFLTTALRLGAARRIFGPASRPGVTRRRTPR